VLLADVAKDLLDRGGVADVERARFGAVARLRGDLLRRLLLDVETDHSRAHAGGADRDRFTDARCAADDRGNFP
jgi:hypothetical protein